MSFNEYVAHVAQCEQRAKTARNEEDKHSWLAMAESWRKSAELRLILERQAQFVHKAGVGLAIALWRKSPTSLEARARRKLVYAPRAFRRRCSC